MGRRKLGQPRVQRIIIVDEFNRVVECHELDKTGKLKTKLTNPKVRLSYIKRDGEINGSIGRPNMVATLRNVKANLPSSVSTKTNTYGKSDINRISDSTKNNNNSISISISSNNKIEINQNNANNFEMGNEEEIIPLNLPKNPIFNIEDVTSFLNPKPKGDGEEEEEDSCLKEQLKISQNEGNNSFETENLFNCTFSYIKKPCLQFNTNIKCFINNNQRQTERRLRMNGKGKEFTHNIIINDPPISEVPLFLYFSKR